MTNVIQIFTLIILVQLCQGFTTLSPKKVFEFRCTVNAPERVQCKVSGYSELECLRAGCCYDNSRNYFIWCYKPKSIEEVEEAEEQVNDFKFNLMKELNSGVESILDQEGTGQYEPTEIQTTTPSNVPQWLQSLLDLLDYFQSKNIFTTTASTLTTPTTTATTVPTTPATRKPQNVWIPNKQLTEQIALDEASCIHTYKLLQSIKGDPQCATLTESRKQCVEGRIVRKYDESECTACTKLGCCYDPSVQDNGVPICYAARTVKNVYTVPSTQSSFLPRPTTESQLPSFGNLGSNNKFLGNQGIGNQGQIPNFGNQLSQKPPGFNLAQMLAMGGPGGVINAPIGGNNINNNNLNLLGLTGGLSNLIPNVKPALGTGFNPLSNTNTGSRPSGFNFGNEGYNRPSIPGLNLPPSNTLFSGNLGGNNILNGVNKGNQVGFNNNKNPLLSLLTTKSTPTTTTQTTPQTTSATTQITVNTEIGFIAPMYEKMAGKLPKKLCYPKTSGTLGGSHSQRGATHRIVGGQWTGGIDYWPWMVSFRRNFTDDWRYKHVCGAALISSRWILTAGHCFIRYLSSSEKIVGKVENNIKVFAVLLGSYYRDSPGLTSQVYALEKFIAHPEYDFKSLKHDIAVAKLQYDASITDYVRPARLPGKFATLEIGARTWVTGWGDTLQIGAHNQSKLKELSLPLVSLRECRKHWKKHFHESWICTEGAYLEDACTGDSGGPLVHQGLDSRWDIIGVAIAGTRRCSTDRDDIRPGIYTNVAYYREFIDSATNGAC